MELETVVTDRIRKTQSMAQLPCYGISRMSEPAQEDHSLAVSYCNCDVFHEESNLEWLALMLSSICHVM